MDKMKRIFPDLDGLSRDSTGNIEVGERWGDPAWVTEGRLIPADAPVPEGWHT